MLRRWQAFFVAFSVCLGWAVVGLIPFAGASRNSSGTYTLPSGNPVVSGSTISSTWANNTLSDISTALTDSLDRTGKGSMQAALQLSTGSCAAPSLTFSADTDVGLWRSTTNTVQLCIASSAIETTSSTAKTLTVPFVGAGITSTPDTANATAVTGTGNGTGAGAAFTGGSGGATLSHGATATAGGTTGTVSTSAYTVNQYGIVAKGKGGGGGVFGLGGSSDQWGGFFEGGGTNGSGIGAEGRGTGAGGVFDAIGTGPAIDVGTGYASFTGSNPTSTTAFTNKLTPANIVKAWGYFTGVSGSSVSVTAGFNWAATSFSTGCATDVDLDLGSNMSSANYAVLVTAGTGFDIGKAVPVDANTVRVTMYDSSAGFGSVADPCTNARTFSVLVIGAQ